MGDRDWWRGCRRSQTQDETSSRRPARERWRARPWLLGAALGGLGLVLACGVAGAAGDPMLDGLILKAPVAGWAAAPTAQIAPVVARIQKIDADALPAAAAGSVQVGAELWSSPSRGSILAVTLVRWPSHVTDLAQVVQASARQECVLVTGNNPSLSEPIAGLSGGTLSQCSGQDRLGLVVVALKGDVSELVETYTVAGVGTPLAARRIERLAASQYAALPNPPGDPLRTLVGVVVALAVVAGAAAVVAAAVTRRRRTRMAAGGPLPAAGGWAPAPSPGPSAWAGQAGATEAGGGRSPAQPMSPPVPAWPPPLPHPGGRRAASGTGTAAEPRWARPAAPDPSAEVPLPSLHLGPRDGGTHGGGAAPNGPGAEPARMAGDTWPAGSAGESPRPRSGGSPPPRPTVPGWHPHPDDPAVRRYWDGRAWTATVRWDGSRWGHDG